MAPAVGADDVVRDVGHAEEGQAGLGAGDAGDFGEGAVQRGGGEVFEEVVEEEEVAGVVGQGDIQDVVGFE